ncbi:hypothetical protein PR048_030654 [Dryococelus australis]|uniref:Uncharacterized protein n=1 Tax=Dryococelus australis TaxID=614101 RepID=A0ABQ9G9J2_9NEOP|nr:hypothetical protein PR048_030654 [Dryococelus australis]
MIKLKRNSNAKPKKWKRNISMAKRQAGKEYVNRKGQVVSEKKAREKGAVETKAEDKKKAAEDNGRSLRTITFDLQAILTVPFAGESNVLQKEVISLQQIDTCLLDYLFQLPESVTHITSFSDTCGRQNRNHFIAIAILYAVNKLSHLNIIDMKFMELGNSYLEADSIHPTIECARKHKQVHTTRQWALRVEIARRKPRPYKVKTLKYSDLQNLASNMLANRKLTKGSEPVKWLDIKWLIYNKDKSFTIQSKYELSDENFMEFDVPATHKTGRKMSWNGTQLCPKNKRLLPVSDVKKNDLLYLLQTGIIPQ